MMDSRVLSLRIAARCTLSKFKSKKKLDSGTVVYEYSDRQIAHRNKKKKERLEKLEGNLERLRAQVKRDLSSKDKEVALTSLACKLLDVTAERVGNSASASGDDTEDGKPHVGVTGWNKDHVTFGKGKATIRYIGKSGVKPEKVVEDKDAVVALRKAYDSCDGDIFECDGVKVTAEKVNAYLKDFDITAKDLRGFHANRAMREALKGVRKGKLPEDKKEREKQLKGEFNKALDTAAAEIQHESATLRSHYLLPEIEESFLKDGTISE